MQHRHAHALGALVAALWPVLLLVPLLPSSVPITPAPWQSYLEFIDTPLHAAMARLALLVPLGDDAMRQSALASVMLGALCASVFVWIDVGIARATRAFELAPALRAPIALGLTWALLARVLMLEPVIVRTGPSALLAAIAVGCAALRFRISTDRKLTVLERARGRATDDKKAGKLALAAACAFMVIGAVYLRGATLNSAELRSDAYDVLQHALLHGAEPRTVLLLSDALAARSARAVHDARPDIEIIEASALFDVKGAEALAAKKPELTALIRSSLLKGALDAPELQAYAAQRPVRLALPLSMQATVRDVLVPAGLFAEVATSSVTSGDLHRARSNNDSYLPALLGELALDELDAATRGLVREQCVLTAALLSPLSRGAYLAEYLDRARMFTHGDAEKKALARALTTVGIPPGAAL